VFFRLQVPMINSRNYLAMGSFKFIVFTLFIFLSTQVTVAQDIYFIEKELSYSYIQNPLDSSQKALSFDDAVLKEEYGLNPVLNIQIPYAGLVDSVQLFVFDSEKANMTSQNNTKRINELPQYTYEVAKSRNQQIIQIYFRPYASQQNTLEVMTRLKLMVQVYATSSNNARKGGKIWASESVLAKGDWYKFRISKSGVYKVTGSDLSKLGININSLNFNELRLYGNGGGMYPESNADFFHDDLVENAIAVYDLNANGKVESTDYFLFYGQGPNIWKYDYGLNRFGHSKHLYDDYAYYYITVKTGTPKRINTISSDPGTPDTTISTFNDFAYHNKDSLNLIKSGKQWFGDEYNVITQYDYAFSFPNLVSSSPVKIKYSVAARSTSASSLNINVNGQNTTLTLPAIPGTYNSAYATQLKQEFSYMLTNGSIQIGTQYQKSTSGSIAWMDYIELNAYRELKMEGNQMDFRNVNATGTGRLSAYVLSGIPANLFIWEITDPTTPTIINYNQSGNSAQFQLYSDSLRSFIAHNGGYYNVDPIGKIDNQNLHATAQCDYVICYHKNFEAQAEELADYHRTKNNLAVFTVDQELLYNEFSGGARDIAALRNFMKMLYDRGIDNGTKTPRYLLLMGDASFDYKSRYSNNTNYVLTFESQASNSPLTSYSSDDFFGLLDDHEGQNCSGALDLGIGRFPVTTASEAERLIDKIKIYQEQHAAPMGDQSFTNTETPNMADWRNMLCFIGDDQDYNIHVSQADIMAEYIADNYPDYNIDKLYLDAYVQQTTPGGQRYPEAKRDLNLRINSGALLLNYTGHGGEIGLAHESLLEVNDIFNWKNKHNMPLFITATCEFSRYDDPTRVSAGEYSYLKNDGGMIALLTTSRLTFSGSNFTLNKYILQNMFKKINGEYPSMGDLARISKVAAGSISNNRNFVLLGDPAIKLSYPEYEVSTLTINGQPINQVSDTLKALSKVTITGQVESNGQIMSSFNGYVYPTVFDKAQDFSTLGNDYDSSPFNFKLQKNIIYKGKAQVSNGQFSFSFIVPKDINYAIGNGKISYYAENGTIDANGYFDSLLVGGSSNQNIVDNDGPNIHLYMNDTLFVDGGLTDENPLLLAFLEDENGINTTGNGIGHDIVLMLDYESSQSLTLNSFYKAKTNSYTEGIIVYPLSNISEGEHVINLKAWDVLNNSNSANLRFIVANSEETMVNSIMNYPNPFTEATRFVFEHNMAGSDLEIVIDIYDLQGKKVRSLQTTINNAGYKVAPDDLRWSGTTENGIRLQSGVYSYQLRVSSSNGQVDEKGGKLVLLN
jgi:hypothetical protein